MLTVCKFLAITCFFLGLEYLLGAYGRVNWYFSFVVLASSLSLGYINWRVSGSTELPALYKRLFFYELATLVAILIGFLEEPIASLVYYLVAGIALIFAVVTAVLFANLMFKRVRAHLQKQT